MSRDIRPLAACLEELRATMSQGVDGTFYMVPEGNEIAVIVLRGGHIESVNFHGHRGDAAILLLQELPGARVTFRPGTARGSRQTQLTDFGIGLLTNPGAVPVTSTANRGSSIASSPSAGTAAPPVAADTLEQQRQAVTAVAFGFLGPVAGTVCSGVLARHSNITDAVDEIADMLPGEEVSRFYAEVARALDQLQ